MALSKLALHVELAPDLGIGPRLGTNPRSESYKYILELVGCGEAYIYADLLTAMSKQNLQNWQRGVQIWHTGPCDSNIYISMLTDSINSSHDVFHANSC